MLTFYILAVGSFVIGSAFVIAAISCFEDAELTRRVPETSAYWICRARRCVFAALFWYVAALVSFVVATS